MRVLTRRLHRRSISLSALAASVLLLVMQGSVAAAPASFGLVRPVHRSNQFTTASFNWSGYDIGTLERGGTRFHSVAGAWTVPTVTQKVPGEAEALGTWTGIGGGCVNATCTLGDNTLIQAGTAASVSTAGVVSYYAFFEGLPRPPVVLPLTVSPGNKMYVSLSESPANSDSWKVTVVNVTTQKTFTGTALYSSTYATAEWIEEDPVNTSSGAFIPLANATTVNFDHALANGVNPVLTAAEEIQARNGTTSEATPSSPDSEGDGFNDCAWATTCVTPPS